MHYGRLKPKIKSNILEHESSNVNKSYGFRSTKSDEVVLQT